MIVTDHFVYIHTSRTAGTFLNKLIMENVPGARMIRYHGHLAILPERFAHLPVIGFTRNPWDWYVSMFNDYKRKHQYVFQVISERGRLGFEQTVERFLRLGDDSALSQNLRKELVRRAPQTINPRTPPRLRNPGLTVENFANFPSDRGYFSWLFGLMYGSSRQHDIRLGRFENLRDDALQLFEDSGMPMYDNLIRAVRQSAPLNGSPRPKGFVDRYPAALQQLVAEKDAEYIEEFDYRFVEPG